MANGDGVIGRVGAADHLGLVAGSVVPFPGVTVVAGLAEVLVPVALKTVLDILVGSRLANFVPTDIGFLYITGLTF